uniref:Lipid droplet-regulating VLDL assembly factor AUP1 n=1 Tax=Geotrypetes seraphini TaxID=260995 RepID=A0A6P8RZ61_GEOSA|nr:ancient ubiquitous protein 1 isoform X2 [Geotrypetes seraphini]
MAPDSPACLILPLMYSASGSEDCAYTCTSNFSQTPASPVRREKSTKIRFLHCAGAWFPSDGFLLLLLFLYTPVGLCLLILRIFIGVHVFLVSCALPDNFIRRFIMRVTCSILGLCVKQNDPRLRDSAVKVYVSNHITHFDHNIINLLTSCNTPVSKGASGFVCWARGFMELNAMGNRMELIEHLKQYSSQGYNLPLLLFPEEETTNGRAGLLKFSSWQFSILDVVQPVALQAQRPFLAVSLADSSWISELLWTFFVPFTVYQVRWMSPVFRQADETNEAMALRVQELLAVELGVVSTRVTAADKAEFVKRQRHVPPLISSTAPNRSLGARPRTSGTGSFSLEELKISRMAQRVKEVLPHVPLSIISKDLTKTNCVDTTITNLLEGKVLFTAEDPSSASASQISTAQSSQGSLGSTSYSLKPIAKTFARSPEDRHLSLQQRKDALYEYATRKYLEKYGLPSKKD